jgi:hypothetical protein
MSIPTATDVKAYLQDFCVTDSITDAKVDDYINLEVVPFVERKLGYAIDSEQELTEYFSGTGRTTLMLDKVGISEIVKVELVRGSPYVAAFLTESFELLPEGILKLAYPIEGYVNAGNYISVFPKGTKNLKVTYKIDVSNDDRVCRAIVLLASEMVLNEIGNRTGGGSISIQGFSKNYGDRAKWTSFKKDLTRRAYSLLRSFLTGIKQ